jgi:hypothetical protein
LLANSFIIDQATIIQLLLDRFSITKTNLGYFFLDYTPNNNILLKELGILIGFNPKEKRLYCIRYIFNLIVESYLYKQNIFIFDNIFKKASPKKHQQF